MDGTVVMGKPYPGVVESMRKQLMMRLQFE